MLRWKIHQIQLQIVEERLKVQQIDIRLEEIVSTASYFLDRTQDILETLQGRMAWVEANKEYPTDIFVKDQETIKQEYELIEFASKAAEELKKEVKRTQGAYVEFCRTVLLSYNRCQTSALKRLEGLPEHEIFLKNLQDRCNEDEKAIQQVKELDEKILKNEVAHTIVSIHLLEDQLCLIPARIAGVKT